MAKGPEDLEKGDQPKKPSPDDLAWQAAAAAIEAQGPPSAETQQPAVEKGKVNIDSLPRNEQLRAMTNMTRAEREVWDEAHGDFSWKELHQLEEAYRSAMNSGKLPPEPVTVVSEEARERESHVKFLRVLPELVAKAMMGKAGVNVKERLTLWNDPEYTSDRMQGAPQAVQPHEFMVTGKLPEGLDPDVARALVSKRRELAQDASYHLRQRLGGRSAVEGLSASKEDVLGDIGKL